MPKRLAKFEQQPDAVANHRLVERDIEIIATIVRYRVISTSLLLHLVKGSPKGIQERLRILYHKRLIQRVPGTVNEECIYYIDNLEALRLLADRSQLPLKQHPAWKSVRNNQKNKGFSRLFLDHELMISGFHAVLELGCRESGGHVELAFWSQGPELRDKVRLPKAHYEKRTGEWCVEDSTHNLPVEPDAFFTLGFPNSSGSPELHFFYEADRGTTDGTKFRQKLRSHFHYVVVERRHREKYGVQRIRAALIHTLTRSWATQLREAAMDPIVSGKPSPLFWFTPAEFVEDPGMVFKPIWATPVDDTLQSLLGSNVAISQC